MHASQSIRVPPGTERSCVSVGRERTEDDLYLLYGPTPDVRRLWLVSVVLCKVGDSGLTRYSERMDERLCGLSGARVPL